MFVCAVNGSPNLAGNTSFLLKSILGRLEEAKIETEVVNLHRAVSSLKKPYCTACSDCQGSCYMGTELEEVYEVMKRADVIILGSPVYFGAPSAQIKTLFDKSRVLRSGRELVGKYGAAVSVGGSKYGGQELVVRAMHDMMLVQGMYILNDGSRQGDAGHGGVCAHRPAAEDDFATKRCEIMAQRIIELRDTLDKP